ncbi:hypothetical protein, partial [Proteiniphilum sp. X52]|uniref:hypothetical protein n=1 Tax=Proteiniphilum sp. X52 TaxID=2382159 RepID=UPI000F4084D3
RLKIGLKNGVLPFNIAENAEKHPKKRSIAVHLLGMCVTDHLNRMENGALPFTRKNVSCFRQDACDQKKRSMFVHFFR